MANKEFSAIERQNLLKYSMNGFISSARRPLECPSRLILLSVARFFRQSEFA
jgi:hypothetical protein